MTVVDIVPRTASRNRGRLWPSLRRWWRRALELRRQRRALARLDEHLLRDIGLTREQALAEARRLPWRGVQG